MEPFANEPIAELRRAAERNRLLEALKRLDPELPHKVPVLIGAVSKFLAMSSRRIRLIVPGGHCNASSSFVRVDLRGQRRPFSKSTSVPALTIPSRAN